MLIKVYQQDLSPRPDEGLPIEIKYRNIDPRRRLRFVTAESENTVRQRMYEEALYWRGIVPLPSKDTVLSNGVEIDLNKIPFEYSICGYQGIEAQEFIADNMEQIKAYHVNSTPGEVLKRGVVIPSTVNAISVLIPDSQEVTEANRKDSLGQLTREEGLEIFTGITSKIITIVPQRLASDKWAFLVD